MLITVIAFLLFLMTASFCAGIAFLIFGKSIIRTDSKNLFIRSAAFIYGKAAYLACFGAGAFLAGIIEISANPYHLFAWSSAYDDWLLGSVINDDEAILKTGQIPQDILDWYAENKGK